MGNWFVKCWFLPARGSCYYFYKAICLKTCHVCEFTNNYAGEDVPYGAEVTVYATTTNPDIDKVRFYWKNPSGDIEFIDCQTVTPVRDENNKFLYSYAISVFKPEKIGEWCVKGEFVDKQWKCWHWTEQIVCTKYTCFNVIPEVPLLGTVGASAAMFSGLVYKMKRKSQKAKV